MAAKGQNRPPHHVDEIYQDLLEAFAGVGEEKQFGFALTLIVALADRIGDKDAIHEAISTSRRAVEGND